MLELRLVCEHCGRALPPNSTDARVCSFECTFCAECVERVLANVCPNCGGGFERRPVRPTKLLAKYPPRADLVRQAVDLAKFAPLKEAQRSIPPHLR
ncbi:MAG: DUF1272 domain-containing protein [Planctomycetes bacterium]|nr:DUF1272 domain-containing protein [Planctomycetota bacterium]